MNRSDHSVGKSRLLLTLVLVNALLFGGGNVLRAEQVITGKCDCCLKNGTPYPCCQAVTCAFGDTCCKGDGDCTNTNCTP